MPYVYKKGDWVASKNAPMNRPEIAKVRDIYEGEPVFDLVMYAPDGSRLGRVSPAMGGPKGFEPWCSQEMYVPIKKPKFPLSRYEWGQDLEYIENKGDLHE